MDRLCKMYSERLNLSRMFLLSKIQNCSTLLMSGLVPSHCGGGWQTSPSHDLSPFTRSICPSICLLSDVSGDDSQDTSSPHLGHFGGHYDRVWAVGATGKNMSKSWSLSSFLTPPVVAAFWRIHSRRRSHYSLWPNDLSHYHPTSL